MVSLAENLITETWVPLSWSEFMAIADKPEYDKASFYYAQGQIRIEMSPLGINHGRQNNICSNVISLFATLKNISIIGLINCSFRKAGVYEFQPDLAFYVGDGLKIPSRSNSPVDLNQYDMPSLVVEVAASSLADDLGQKRLLYERIGVREYWVVDVSKQEVIAFAISQGRSGEIRESQVLGGLAMGIVEEAFKRANTEDDGKINRWLIETFSQL